MKPSELKRVQQLLADIERSTNQLKDDLVKVRAREHWPESPYKQDA